MRDGDDINPYEILGVTPRADDVVVRAAWKALIRKYHPDSSTVPDAPARAAKINAAFRLLATPEARAAHDRRSAPAPVPPRPPSPMSVAAARRREPPPRRRSHRFRIFALAGTAAALIGAAILYVAGDNIGFPGPMQRMADGILIDPSVARFRTDTRRMLGLDAPSAYAAQPPEPAAEIGPPPSVNEAAITATVERFDALLAHGVAAAAAEGQGCRAQAENTPSWEVLDSCAAIHLAGFGAAEGLFGPPEPGLTYFEQAALEIPGRYAAISSDSAGRTARIETIRKIVWSTMLRKAEARFRAHGQLGYQLAK